MAEDGEPLRALPSAETALEVVPSAPAAPTSSGSEKGLMIRTPQRQRTALNAAQKKEICLLREKHGWTQQKLAEYMNEKYGSCHVKSNTVSKILGGKHIWLNIPDNPHSANRFRQRGAKWPNLEKQLNSWVLAVRGTEGSISDQQILEKAQNLAKDLGMSEEQCKLSKGWLGKFKARCGLSRVAPISSLGPGELISDISEPRDRSLVGLRMESGEGLGEGHNELEDGRKDTDGDGEDDDTGREGGTLRDLNETGDGVSPFGKNRAGGTPGTGGRPVGRPPSSIRAIRAHVLGGIHDTMVIDKVRAPKPGRRQVLVSTRYCGVNHLDLHYLRGKPLNGDPAPQLPFTLGFEAVGTVQFVGDGVKEFRQGDRVGILTESGGTFAEKVVVDDWKVVDLPDDIQWDEACASLLYGVTAVTMVKDCYRVKAGDSVLVHGGAGGTGQAIIQAAKISGADMVIATVSSDEKVAVARNAGADHVIVYTRVDFVTVVQTLTKGRGVDVVYDGVGKTTINRDFNAVRKAGTVVLYGGASGMPDNLDVNVLSRRSITFCRPSIFHYLSKPDALKWAMREVTNWMRADKFKIKVAAVLQYGDIQRAYRAMINRSSTGKYLLVPKDAPDLASFR